MISDNNCAGNLYLKSNLGPGDRRAGTGIIEDDYSDRVWTNKGIVEVFTAQTNNSITTY